MKNRIMWSTLQAVIGLVLLGVCYVYLHAHDAELTNFASGMQILKDKIHYIATSFGGKASMKDFQEQQSLIRSYKELLHYIDQSGCTIAESTSTINAKLEQLTKIDSAEYKQHTQEYSSYATVVYREIQECIAAKK
jgi:hypothetical protein